MHLHAIKKLCERISRKVNRRALSSEVFSFITVKLSWDPSLSDFWLFGNSCLTRARAQTERDSASLWVPLWSCLACRSSLERAPAGSRARSPRARCPAGLPTGRQLSFRLASSSFRSMPCFFPWEISSFLNVCVPKEVALYSILLRGLESPLGSLLVDFITSIYQAL